MGRYFRQWGYNSATNDACLYVVTDRHPADLVEKDLQGVTGWCNGLATPLAIMMRMRMRWWIMYMPEICR
ncbi:MAG: hypothetical protein U5K27_21180 [Desulfotignum sp.]|nr:hypothetical protein [Desulfotignum sp.]